MGQISMWLGIAALIFLQNVSAFNLVCYFTSWSQYREAPGRFVTDDIEPGLCTHLIYAFANISGNQITTYEWNDESTYENLRELKTRNPKLKILLSVGGYHSGSEPFRKINTSPHTRSEFARSVISFLRHNNFDGLDVAWNGPSQNDRRHLVNLVQDLNIAFHNEVKRNPKKQSLILSVAVAGGREAIDNGFDIPNISRFVDFLNVLSLDFHGYWQDHSHPYTGHVSPLRKNKADKGSASSYNVDYAIRYLKTKGAPDRKIIMGIPTYGQTFTLSSAQTGVGAPASGPGLPGTFTKLAGILAYYEICSFNHDAKKEKIEEQEVPYSYKGNQWVGYEDETSVQAKVRYAKDNNLGGVMVWTLDLDDFSGTFCKKGNYPLLAAIKNELNK
ncbi:chitinase-3-like protein 1 [Python bivittatus]|uniref:Chitinase-3-like protein 1 n=1 Tax=Python bivittatus TaxID=176946 RepID=A0A9F2QUJ7_PYTBI|nr:chitinase-3-like protein 1 [Python bivittatus]